MSLPALVFLRKELTGETLTKEEELVLSLELIPTLRSLLGRLKDYGIYTNFKDRDTLLGSIRSLESTENFLLNTQKDWSS